jgi:hypothetical protein
LGKCLLRVAEAGTYRFEVRRWPREAGKVAMTAGLPPACDPDIEYFGIRRIDVPGKALDVKAVELEITGQEVLRKEVVAGAEAVTFDIELPAGNIDLHTRMAFTNGEKKGADYVYIEMLPGADSDQIEHETNY